MGNEQFNSILDSLMEDKYYDSIEYICKNDLNDIVVQKWLELFKVVLEHRRNNPSDDTSICRYRLTHIILLRWYQLKERSQRWINLYGNDPHPGPQMMIECDADLFSIASIFYALFRFIDSNYQKIINPDADFLTDECKALGKLQINKLRQEMNYAGLESFINPIETDSLRILNPAPIAKNAEKLIERWKTLETLRSGDKAAMEKMTLDIANMLETDFENICDILVRVMDSCIVQLKAIGQNNVSAHSGIVAVNTPATSTISLP